MDVPRVWQSFPRNCAVKLDTVLPEATDSFRLQTLTRQGEEIIASCIIQGHHCGGIINVGPKRVMQLSVGYYASIPSNLRGQEPANISLVGQDGVVAQNRSLDQDDDTATS